MRKLGRSLSVSLMLSLVPASSGALAAGAVSSVTTSRQLTLRETLDLALRSDPAIAAALASRGRSDVAVLRAQLDRFSLKVESSLTEQWRIDQTSGGAAPPSCTGLIQVPSTAGVSPLLSPMSLVTSQGGPPTQAECEAAMGLYSPGSSTSAGWSQSFLGQLNLSANLQVPLFTGFRLTANVSRARRQRDAASATTEDAQRQVALAALRAYWTVRRLEARQQVSEEALTRYKESMAAVTWRVRAGLAAQADINRMETRRQAELANLADLRGNADESRAQLAVALGLGGAQLVLVEPIEVPAAPPSRPEDVEALLAPALRERPDLRAAQMTRLAAASFVRSQLSNYYPQLSLSSLMQFGNNPYNPLTGARSANAAANPFANITGSAYLGGTLSLNIFDTLNTYTAVKDARLDHRRLLAEERRIGRVVETDVRTFHARLLRHYSMREPLLRTRDIARDSLNVVRLRYRNGDVSLLDLMDAQLELLKAESELIDSTTTIVQTWGELVLATGRLPT